MQKEKIPKSRIIPDHNEFINIVKMYKYKNVPVICLKNSDDLWEIYKICYATGKSNFWFWPIKMVL